MDPVGAIIVDGQRRTVVVQYTDPDEDPITFRWFVDGQPEERINRVFATRDIIEGVLVQGSVLTIDRDEVDDGMEVECRIRDDDPDLPAQTLRWVIVERS